MSQLNFPPIYLLPTHIDPDQLPDLQSQIPSLTYDINEAEVVLGKISKKQRALFELRRLKVVTEEVAGDDTDHPPPAKRRRLSHDTLLEDDASTASDNEDQSRKGVIHVVKLSWFTDSVSRGDVMPLEGYLLYRGLKLSDQHGKEALSSSSDVLGLPKDNSASATDPRLLTHEIFLPEADAAQPPNDAFIEQLKDIRTTRALLGDKIGVRAYSTCIAAVAAYPHLLTNRIEVDHLPGCGTRIASLFHEWKTNGCIEEVENAKSDAQLSVLRLFYKIWGVGETTAQEFYKRGWRDLDDIVEYGWDQLSRVQQIGVKYYDEFLLEIPRAEVKSIADIILEHANRLHKGYEMVIVGGYRRGKSQSGDVDVVISHRDPAATLVFIDKIVDALAVSGHITHILTISTRNSERGQEPLAWKGEGRQAGSGFDTLDKAMVVWQTPEWDRSSAAKNSNPHRRVDIIVTPWKTAGCAIEGWTSGTTFQRDLRRYCKTEKRLKFDSSGVRSRVDGSWVDLESGPDGAPAPDMITAEQRVFKGLGLEWRLPEERNTG
ncbi:Nucleotidyltransferase [Apiospora rasikravindrae]|uniref:DNA polymerase n=1 Tax=Apiospora rasikravindrae TaxID=990691 RepID=A0ABR1SLH4_9PEZI